jgi:hypothetical protein
MGIKTRDVVFNVPVVSGGFYGVIRKMPGILRHKNFGWSGAWEPKAI